MGYELINVRQVSILVPLSLSMRKKNPRGIGLAQADIGYTPAHILCHDITSAVRPGTATPEAVLLQYEAAKGM